MIDWCLQLELSCWPKGVEKEEVEVEEVGDTLDLNNCKGCLVFLLSQSFSFSAYHKGVTGSRKRGKPPNICSHLYILYIFLHCMNSRPAIEAFLSVWTALTEWLQELGPSNLVTVCLPIARDKVAFRKWPRPFLPPKRDTFINYKHTFNDRMFVYGVHNK